MTAELAPARQIEFTHASKLTFRNLEQSARLRASAISGGAQLEGTLVGLFTGLLDRRRAARSRLGGPKAPL